MRTGQITFPGALGEPLAARLEMPETEPRAVAVFAHCFTCGKDSVAAVRISRALAAQGFAVLRFDFTGLGGSGGDFANTHFSSNVADLVAAADYLRGTLGAPALLVGHSLGGAAVLAAAHRLPEVAAVVTIGAPSDAGHVEHLFGQSVAEIEAEGQATVSLGGRPFTIRSAFLDDIRGTRQAEHIASLKRALLVMHAPMDATVSIDNATRIFVAAKHPKSFVSLDTADHLLTRPQDAEYAATVISAWAARYIPVVPPTVDPEGVVAEEGAVVVEETGRGKLQNRITVGSYGFLADEPASYGGLGSGPSPYDLVAAGLGACKSMTIRMYADHKGIPLDRVRVQVRHEKIHATDCADCETKDGRLDEFRVEITLDGQLDTDQSRRLVEIADRCPVHKTLHSEVKIRTVERSGS